MKYLSEAGENTKKERDKEKDTERKKYDFRLYKTGSKFSSIDSVPK